MKLSVSLYAVFPVVVSCLPCTPVQAQNLDSCMMAARNQAQINECSTQRYRAADAALNHAYKEIRAGIKPGHFDKLREAQRAWVAFRDLNCESQTLDYVGGSLYSSNYNTCLADVTEARTAELRRVYLNDAEDDASTLSENMLAGTWRALENNYGLEITLGMRAGVHYFSSQLNGLPYEAGQWQFTNGKLTITANNGQMLHTYSQVKLDNGVLSLYEQDGGVETYKKLPGMQAQ